MLETVVDARIAQRVSKLGPDYRERLKALAVSLATTFTFNSGDLVEWKPGLRNKGHPDYGVAAVVLTTHAQPVFDETQNAGSAYFREPLDLVIGVLDSDGDLAALHVDSRRFQPFSES